MNMYVGRSKSGLPTVTENGGGSSNTGSAQVVCGAHGESVKPLFVPRGYSNGDHAIFVARVGMHIVTAGHSRSGEWADAYKIVSIGNDDNPDALVIEKVGEYENGDGTIPDFLNDAVEAALNKSHDYHCRSPHYIA